MQRAQVLAMSSQETPNRLARESGAASLAILLGVLITIAMSQGLHLTSRGLDLMAAPLDTHLPVEELVAAIAIYFAKVNWKKRPAPPTDSNATDGDANRRSPYSTPSPKKLPRASAMSPTTGTRSATSQAPRPREGPVVMSVRPYGLDAHDLWSRAPEETRGYSLWQLQVTHDVEKPITRDLLRHFGAYLAVLHAENPLAPSSIGDLERQQNIRFVLTKPDTDTANAWIGYKDWRLAIYICAPAVSEIQNFLALWDGFLVYRRRVGRTEGLLDFCMRIHLQHDIPINETTFDYPTYDIIRECVPSDLPHAATDAWPPGAPHTKSMLKVVLQVESESEMTFVLTGHTWPFRERIRSLGGRDWEVPDENSLPSEARNFVRVLPVYTTDPAIALSFFGGAVLQEAPVLVYVEDEVAPGTPNAAVLDAIGSIPSVARLVLQSGA